MFAYCGNNPVMLLDPRGTIPVAFPLMYDEDEDDGSSGSYRFLGFGFQGEFSVGCYEMGLEIIIYTDPLVCGGEGPRVAVYTYEGTFAGKQNLGHSAEVQIVIEKLLLAAATNAVDEANAEALLIALQAALFQDVGASGSVLALFGNDSFRTTAAYNGAFDTYSLTIRHVKVSYSTSPSCRVVAVGASTERFDFSFGQSYYSQLV